VQAPRFPTGGTRERTKLCLPWTRPASCGNGSAEAPNIYDLAIEAVSRRQLERAEDNRALRWNLHAWEDPRLPASIARPVWVSAAHPWVLKASASALSIDRDCLDIAELAEFAKIIHSAGAQRLLLSDGYHCIRLDVSGASLEASPVQLSYALSGIRDLRRPLIVLQRLRSFVISGCFRSGVFTRFKPSPRIVRLLRAFDALRAGASHADIAEVLVTSDLHRRCWRIHSPSVRSQAQRLAHAARRMAAGKFWQLLE
jgi:hypothetical protein